MTDEQLDKPFTLTEINVAALSLASLIDTLPPDQALAEMAKLQRNRATFWRTASSHVGQGKKLSSFLSTYWPAMYATPVAIAEETGKLPTIMDGLAATAELQMEIRNTMLKLLYPLTMILLGIGVNLFMLLAVIPSLTFSDGTGRSNGVMRFSRTVHDLIASHPVLLLAVLAGFVYCLYRLAKRPDITSTLLAKLDNVPTLSGTIRALYFGLWARYISLMEGCGIALQDALQLSEPLLLPYMVPSIAAVRDNARTGFRDAVDLDQLSADDPRQKLPIHICNAFRLTENTGTGAKHFESAANPLIKLGLAQIKRVLTVANNVASVAAAIIAVSPMGMYFMQMTDLLSHAVH